MKQMEIFEQAMCCPTGLCGPSIDPELLRLSAVLETLKGKGIVVGRYNLSNDPMKFVQTKAVTDFLQNHGPEELPLVLVDGAVQFSGRYPTNEEFADILGFDVALLMMLPMPARIRPVLTAAIRQPAAAETIPVLAAAMIRAAILPPAAVVTAVPAAKGE